MKKQTWEWRGRGVKTSMTSRSLVPPCAFWTSDDSGKPELFLQSCKDAQKSWRWWRLLSSVVPVSDRRWLHRTAWTSHSSLSSVHREVWYEFLLYDRLTIDRTKPKDMWRWQNVKSCSGNDSYKHACYLFLYKPTICTLVSLCIYITSPRTLTLILLARDILQTGHVFPHQAVTAYRHMHNVPHTNNELRVKNWRSFGWCKPVVWDSSISRTPLLTTPLDA